MATPEAVGPLLGVDHPLDVPDLGAVDKVVILERNGPQTVPGHVRAKGQGMFVVAVNKEHQEPAENTISMLSQTNMRGTALSKLAVSFA